MMMVMTMTYAVKHKSNDDNIFYSENYNYVS